MTVTDGGRKPRPLKDPAGGFWIGLLAFCHRAWIMPHEGLHATRDQVIVATARYYLDRLSRSPACLGYRVALRELEWDHYLTDAAAGLVPENVALWSKVVEMHLDGRAPAVFSRGACWPNPLRILVRAILAIAASEAAGHVRIHPLAEGGMRVWFGSNDVWKEAMNIPEVLEDGLRGELRRTHAIGCDAWLALDHGEPTFPRWRSIEERPDGTILIELQSEAGGAARPAR